MTINTQKTRRFVRHTLLACLMLPALLAIASAAPVGAATFAVTTTNDSGAGSLRQALIDASDTGGTISFAIIGGGARTITLASSLPTIAGNIAVDGTTEPGYAGAPLITIDGGGTFITAFTVSAGATLTLSGLVIENVGHGGIVSAGALAVHGCLLQSNVSSSGGGAIATNGGSVAITESLFSMNSDIGAGGGGAISIDGGTVAITGSTFSGNYGATGGGAILVNTVAGPPVLVGTLYLTNSTLTGNSVGTHPGGALYVNPSASATLTNVTVTENHAGGGGGIFNNGATTLANTIVANNVITAGGFGPDLSRLAEATFTDDGHNLIGIADSVTAFTDVSAGGSDYTGTTAAPRDPGLAPLPLANNGGPIPTDALQPTSIAINHGDNAVCTNGAGPTAVGGKDQRGVLRPQGSVCDIGAYEYLVLALNGTTIPTSGGTVTLVGTGFQPGLTLTVDGASAPVTNVTADGTALTAIIPAHLPGAVTASVSEPIFVPSPVATTLTYVNFTPAVQVVSPSSGSIGGGARVTITGAYFAPSVSVSFGGVPAQNVTVASDTKITATVPPHTAPGAVTVMVMYQGLSRTLTGGYTYGVVNALPTTQPTAPAPPSGAPNPLPSQRPAATSAPDSAPSPLPMTR
jgi:hypothetical protein